MSAPAALPATVTQLWSHGQELRIELYVDGHGSCEVAMTVPPATSHALPHIHALHGHAQGCRGQADVHVELLLRCCRALGSATPRLVVRADDVPAFWLEVTTPGGGRAQLDVGVLDALVLLASRRTPVGVVAPTPGAGGLPDAAPGASDWDDALRRLLDGGSPS